MLYARIKSGTCPSYLTAGKEYEVIWCRGKEPDRFFRVFADNGLIAKCLENDCDHLSGGDWELYEKGETNGIQH